MNVSKWFFLLSTAFYISHHFFFSSLSTDRMTILQATIESSTPVSHCKLIQSDGRFLIEASLLSQRNNLHASFDLILPSIVIEQLRVHFPSD